MIKYGPKRIDRRQITELRDGGHVMMLTEVRARYGRKVSDRLGREIDIRMSEFPAPMVQPAFSVHQGRGEANYYWTTDVVKVALAVEVMES